MKQYLYLSAIWAVSITMTACGNSANQNMSSNTSVAAASQLFSERDLSGEYDASKCEQITLSDAGCTSDSSAVAIGQNTVTITKEGDYIINGSLSDGMVIVDVEKSEKVQLILNGVTIHSESSAPIYIKKADKVFVTLAEGTENTLTNGGKFTAIDDNNIDAVIFSKDDLTLNGTGTLIVQSPSAHGIVSKNELVVTDGTYEITAASQGLSGKENVAIADGNFAITAGKAAIKSANDDGNTQGNVYIGGGSFELSAGTDGINALNEVKIEGGDIKINQSYEGIEARIITILGGAIELVSSNDGFNATDKRSTTETNTEETEQEIPGGKMGDTQPDASIQISGGIVKIDAEGDGIDTNGYLTISGGEVYVAGASHGGDGALDYGIDASISGGIVVAAGQRNMAQNFGSESTQGSILINTEESNAADSDIVLVDSDGKELVAWTMKKSYNSVVISCPEITENGTYTVQTGDISTEVVMDGLIYGQGFEFGGRRPGFGNGEKPEGMPDLKNGEKPEGMTDFKNGEKPEGMPDFKNGEKPEELPDSKDENSSQERASKGL